MNKYKPYIAGILLGFSLASGLYNSFSYYAITIILLVLIYIYKELSKYDNTSSNSII